jgi:S-adenosylmethionine:tRNA ribosyltransferase-isomerase
MTPLPFVNINDFNYSLPVDRIAQFPVEKRDESKLIIYKDKKISEDLFKNIPAYLPDSGLLIYNETKVIQARMLFQKESGAQIEIFCLEPVSPTREIQQAFEQQSGVVWKCLVGNSKKWKSGKLQKLFILKNKKGVLTAERKAQFKSYSLIEFQWEPGTLSFSDILLASGIIPLPPYMKRKAVENDKLRYQTIYAGSEGSVAAPTAGLHFTEPVLQKIMAKGIAIEDVTLHIGAGTFKPVSTDEVGQHEMHTEKIVIKKATIQKIIEKQNQPIIVVGTTTTRTLESLYWFGVKLLVDNDEKKEIDIKQWDPYSPIYNVGISLEQSFNKILDFMGDNGLDVISGQTQLMIIPGYSFRIPDILITNFHMPRSTLLLLVSAFIGEGWENIYEYALNHNFRFLSYGDSCLFFKQ